MTQPEQQPATGSHPRGENADRPPAEPSVQDQDLAAETAEASGAGG
jgi:hypothetical protein